MLIFFVGCSGVLKRKDILGPAGGAKDDIPDNFPEEAKLNTVQFTDKTDDYGLTGVSATSLYVVDFNGDFYSDIVVIPSYYSYPQFYFYDRAKKKFVKGKSPFKYPAKASFLIFTDLNNDQVLDAIIGVLNQKTELSKEPLKIFMGSKAGGQLSFDKPIEIKLSLSNSTIGLVDYDLDGFLDLYIGNWFQMVGDNAIPAPDYLFQNVKGKEFVDITKKLRGENKQNPDKTMFFNATPTYGSQICDMDQNGYPDILTTSTNRFDNKLWMNRYLFREKQRFFEEQGRFANYSADSDGLINKQGGGRTFGIACADYNNDGIMDVFLGELNHNYDNAGVDKSSILTGRTFKYPPKFYRTEYFLDSFDPQWHEADRRGVWADFNNDGLMDLIVDNSGYPPHSRLIFFQQLYDHSFTNKAQEYGIDLVNPISTVTLDINRDGKLDILTAQSSLRDELLKPRLFLFENNLELKGKRSLKFYLRGQKSNSYGINATVILKVITKDGKLESRMQNVSYSYGALPPQNEEGIHFGLNEGETLDSVVVRWPFSTGVNAIRSQMEKRYKISYEFEDTINVTLCENGNYLIGRRNCL